MPITLRAALILALCLSCFGVAARQAIADDPPPLAASRPNVLFIMADDLGHAHLGCYGGTKIATPHIDRLATEGLRFTQAYAGCSVCAPCRSVLMTGYHMGHTPVRANMGAVPLFDADRTVAEELKSGGYATGCFGKWGLGEDGSEGVPYKQGFDEFFGYLHQVHAHFYYPEYLWENDRKFVLEGNADGGRGRYAHDEIVDRALDYLRSRSAGDEPFFCYVPVTIPHVELVVPEDSLAPYRGKFDEVPIDDPREGYIDADEPFATYAGMISRMDRDVGRMLAALDELGIAENTLVIFTSDNGAQGGGPWQPLLETFDGNGSLRGSKGSMYEGGIRVPMIARWKGTIEPGRTSDVPCYFADVMPTLAELAGPDAQKRVPADVDGRSLVPVLAGSTPHDDSPRFLYWELGGEPPRTQAVRWGKWKAVRPRANAPLELYDLSADESESNNCAAEFPDVMERIEAYLKTARTKPREQIAPTPPEGQRYR